MRVHQRPKEKIFSGPQPREKLPDLIAVGVHGELVGKEFNPIAEAGNDLHLFIVAVKGRTFGRLMPPLITRLQAIEKASGKKWHMSFIVNTDNPNEDAELNPFGRYPWVRYGVAKGGALGPLKYGIDRNVTATVILAKNGKVVHNLVYPQDLFYTTPHILGAIARAVEVDRDTLRKHIRTDTYMSNEAYTLNKNGHKDGGDSTPQSALRQNLKRWSNPEN